MQQKAHLKGTFSTGRQSVIIGEMFSDFQVQIVNEITFKICCSRAENKNYKSTRAMRINDGEYKNMNTPSFERNFETNSCVRLSKKFNTF